MQKNGREKFSRGVKNIFPLCHIEVRIDVLIIASYDKIIFYNLI